jgi:1-phosphofructokinase family hexose kinase
VALIVTVTPNPALDRTLTVPRVLFNQRIRATAVRLDWGGKGFNVSRALQALGIESIAMGFVGGAVGQQIERGLANLGIATDFIYTAGETRTNTVIINSDTGQYIKVNEAGPTVKAEEVALLLDRVHERARPGDLWGLSGSLPPGVPVDLYAQLIAIVEANGATALLDSSGAPLRLGCAARPYLVKPNKVETQEMIGRDINSEADAISATEFFLDQGVALVALSLGADGLLLASRQETVWARPPNVRVRNPVGAGDALLAGVAWAVQRGLSLEEIARWGVATGTAAALHEGISVGARAEVEALYDRIGIG